MRTPQKLEKRYFARRLRYIGVCTFLVIIRGLLDILMVERAMPAGGTTAVPPASVVDLSEYHKLTLQVVMSALYHLLNRSTVLLACVYVLLFHANSVSTTQ